MMPLAHLLPFVVFVASAAPVSAAAPAGTLGARLTLSQRSLVETAAGSGVFRARQQQADWDPRRTAIIVCDMWNEHWCRGATERVAEMAPRMNAVLTAARRAGIFVIHCPSDTMKFYQDAHGRKLAQATKRAELKSMPPSWCPLAGGREPALPFDNSQDRCDCSPQCPHGNPWRRQIATLEIAEGDAITDNDEALFLIRERNIEHVIVMGVHTNMCVLGRPFSIRRLCAQGLDVVLMRDLTDSMHDSQSAPVGLDHFRATDLVVEHIEKYWCPTVTSSDLLGGAAFAFRDDRRPHVVFMIGEDEYKTDQTLPEFAARELANRGVRVTIVHANPRDANDFPGLEALDTADALLVSVRRRTPPTMQLDRVRKYVAAGKPVVGIRTASHAFSLRDKKQPPAGNDAWPEFDADVLGGHYTGHHEDKGTDKPNTLVRVAPAAKDNPLVSGMPAEPVGSQGTLYKTSPLGKSTSVLLVGRCEGEYPEEPVAWTNTTSGGGRVFYTSLGHPADFDLPAFRSLLTRGIFWALGKELPKPST